MAFSKPFCISVKCKSHSAVGIIYDMDDTEDIVEISSDIETVNSDILKQPKPHAAIAVSKSLSLLPLARSSAPDICLAFRTSLEA